MKKSCVNFGLAFALAAVLCNFTGCASIQKDVVMSTDSFVQSEDVMSLEERFIEFDAGNILNGDVATDIYKMQEADSLNRDIENCIKSTGMNEPVLPRLYALEGLTCLMQGKASRAKSLYNKSLEAGKGDSYTVILGYRLGLVESIVDENVVSGTNENSLLDLEQGLAFFGVGEYAKSVAQLDAAFINLPEMYKNAYSEIRQIAWDLRNNSDVTDDKAILQLLNRSQITVGQMILIAQETSDLLYVINGGKRFSEQDLFTHLASAGYFDSSSAVETETKPKAVKKNQLVDRQLCARFMWNVYCIKKNYTDQKTKYSTVYRDSYGMSPIPDVDLNSPDFDAILGVVENEIMDLPDGQNFQPEELVAASVFNAWFGKIK